MKAISESQEKICDMESLKKQLESQKSTLENIEMENVRLTQRLHANLEEMRSVTKERDDLRRVEETLKVERDQLKENLGETVIRVSYHLSPFPKRIMSSGVCGSIKLVQPWGKLKEVGRLFGNIFQIFLVSLFIDPKSSVVAIYSKSNLED